MKTQPHRLPLFPEHNVPDVVLKIFCNLDNASLATCLLVSKDWNHFIQKNIYNNKYLRERFQKDEIKSSWLKRRTTVRNANNRADHQRIKSIWKSSLDGVSAIAVTEDWLAVLIDNKGDIVTKVTISDDLKNIDDIYIISTANFILIDNIHAKHCQLIDKNNGQSQTIFLPWRLKHTLAMIGHFQVINSSFSCVLVEESHVYEGIFDFELALCQMINVNTEKEQPHFEIISFLPVPTLAKHPDDKQGICSFKNGVSQYTIQREFLALACRHGLVGVYSLSDEIASNLYFVRHHENPFRSVRNISITEEHVIVVFDSNDVCNRDEVSHSTIQVFNKTSGDLVFLSNDVCAPSGSLSHEKFLTFVKRRRALSENSSHISSVYIVFLQNIYSSTDDALLQLDFDADILFCQEIINEEILLLQIGNDSQDSCGLVAIDISNKGISSRRSLPDMRVVPKVSVSTKNGFKKNTVISSMHSFFCINNEQGISFIRFNKIF